jgi:hypothetical protein
MPGCLADLQGRKWAYAAIGSLHNSHSEHTKKAVCYLEKAWAYHFGSRYW